MGLFLSYWTGEFALPAPVGYQDRKAFRISLTALNRMRTIGIEALNTGRTIIFFPSECIFRAGFPARHDTALTGLEILRRAAGGKASFDQYRAKSDSGAPFSVQEQVVFSHDAQTSEHCGIFQIYSSFFHVVGQWLCTNPMSPE